MEIKIESIICNWANEIPHILIRVINAVALSANEEELRTSIRQIAEETKLDEFFAYGYGAHHFWLTHVAAGAQLQVGRDPTLDSKLVKSKDAEGQKYKDYFNYSSPLKRMRSHTLLAIRLRDRKSVV